MRGGAAAYGLIGLAVALNLGLGLAVGALRLPLFLDSCGTLLASVLGGWQAGLLVAGLGVVAGSLVIAPTTIAYLGTAAVVALAAAALRPLGFLRRPVPTVLGGLAIGVAGALASAPVTAFFFAGVSLTGSDAVTAFFRATGRTLGDSVLFGGLATDPIDKLASALIAMMLIRAMPGRVLENFRYGSTFRRPTASSDSST